MDELIFQHFLKIKSVSTDTRNIQPNSIFFALKGDTFNGNLFAKQALEQGASLAVVDEEVDSSDTRIVRVDCALKALQQLALNYRRTFSIPFLAITGSNGKTTTKELIRDVLTKKYKVHATLGNLNNHIGIPLTLLSIPQDCEFAIIEMGANHQKEISSYCLYTEPNYGLITNMGKAHLEGFGGEEGVIKGKRELYDYLALNGGKAFINIELPKLKEAAGTVDTIPYGLDQPGFELKIIRENPVITYELIYKTRITKASTNLVGAYNLFNIASAITVGLYFKVKDPDIHTAISSYKPDNNRSQLTHTNRNTIILDAYNANPTSMGHALLSLASQQASMPYFIIGDMRELGEASHAEHKKILELITDLQLEGIAIGKDFSAVSAGFDIQTFRNLEDASAFLRSETLSKKTILLKGSRGMHMEDLLPLL